MEVSLTLDNDPLKAELSKEAELKGISLEKHIAEILEEYISRHDEDFDRKRT